MNNKIRINRLKYIKYLFIALLLPVLCFQSCTDDKLSAPPVVTLFVNNDDVTANPAITVASGTRVEYRFEIAASTTIANLKTVITDLRKPDAKTFKELIVGGQTNALNQTVKSVIFPLYNQEIMLVVKDVDGNEVTKTFAITIQ